MKKLLLPLLLVCGACGDADPAQLTREGTTALNAGQYDAAFAKLDAAVQGMDATHPQFLEASVNRCRARAGQDPSGARDDFLALAGQHPDKIEARDYEMIAESLRAQRAHAEAIDVLAAGMARHSESLKLAALRDQLGKEAEQAGDPEALKALQGLGYVGD